MNEAGLMTYNERQSTINELTAVDIIELIRQNGHPYGKHAYIMVDWNPLSNYTDGVVNGACAYGQAALNIPLSEEFDVIHNRLNLAEDIHTYAEKLHPAFEGVIILSDVEEMSPQDIADWLDLEIRYDEVVRVHVPLLTRIKNFFGGK